MDSFYTIIALLTAGVSLATGLINLFTGLHKDGDKVDLVFGVMCLWMFIFFLIPPIGFILEDKAPYPLQVDIKRLFNNTFNGLFPWFIILYTGYRKKMIAYIISALVILYYGIMVFTKTDSQKPVWVYLVLLALVMNMVFGFFAGFSQIRNGERKKGRWLIFAMGFFAFFCILTLINQLGNNYFGRIFGTKLFFPINLFPLSFMVIMGIRLRENTFEKYRLEKILRLRDMRWDLLLQNMQLIIIELDKDGRIKYLNPYAIDVLGYTSSNELINKNWFDYLPLEEAASVKVVFENIMKEQEAMPFYRNRILAKDGKERIVNWTNVLVYDDTGEAKGLLSIGADVTEQEKAFEKIEVLRTELEKENLLPGEEQIIEESEYGIIGHCEAIIYAIQKAKQVATTSATVLLEGETGVGKELFADFIHKHSSRKNKIIVKINCAALPPDLIESELFGHEKGAFTGALQMRKGKFELADGGTIFLDEIGELPLALQPKLLRVLQSGEFERIGAQQTIRVDVRIISATNRDLHKAVKEGQFREDLYYRLNVFPVTIPALRNRKEDIPSLVRHFVNGFAREHGKQIESISKADMIRLTEYQWPGNIRELINVIERSIISTSGNILKLDWFKVPNLPTDINDAVSIEEVERLHIMKVLKDCGWKINGDDGAAAKLGLHPNTLRSRMKKLNIIRAEA
ncbi:MAG TPA: sigma 54-interacting transcriptional regulator [Chitinophagaceae bacterium]|jgi:PAS domain S-box-containing protein